MALALLIASLSILLLVLVRAGLRARKRALVRNRPLRRQRRSRTRVRELHERGSGQLIGMDDEVAAFRHRIGPSGSTVTSLRSAEGERDKVFIPSKTISRRHARIEHRLGVYWVIDEDSRNGTWVNDERVRGRRRLVDGDIIRFHDRAFVFRARVLYNRTTNGAPRQQAGRYQ